MELLFTAANLVPLPFWLLMILLPHWRVTRRVMQSPWVVAPIAWLYVILVLPGMAGLIDLLAAPSLDTIAAALSTPRGALMAWVHLLAFDLFAGRWAYLDSRERQVTAWLASLALLFIYMLGPLGLLLYLGLRVAYRRDG